MTRCYGLRKLVSLTVAATLLLPSWSKTAIGSEPPTPNASSARDVVFRPVDIELGAENTLLGHVIDSEQKGVADAEVAIYQGKQIIAHGRTAADGQFAIQVPRGGVYIVSAEQRYRLVRAWTAGRAPRKSPRAVELDEACVIRAQDEEQRRWYEGSGPMGLSLLGSLAVLTVIAAVAAPIAAEKNRERSPSSTSP